VPHLPRALPVLAAVFLGTVALASKPGLPPAPATREACLAAGGAWDDVSGRGHIRGCNLPASDGEKACSDSKECDGACRNGLCSDHREVRGCGILEGGRKLCLD